LIPFAAATGNHQTANAQGLVAASGAVLLVESAASAQSLAAEITHILSDPRAAQKMAAASLAFARPNAARELADLAEKLAQ